MKLQKLQAKLTTPPGRKSSLIKFLPMKLSLSTAGALLLCFGQF